MVSTLILLAGIAIVVITAMDVISTLVVTTVSTAIWRPARIFYRYAWRTWRGLGRRLEPGHRRERWMAFFGPVSILSVLLLWLVMIAVGWALIYKESVGELHGSSDFLSLLYYSGATLLSPNFGEVTSQTAPAGLLSLSETVMGYGAIALLISYLPVLYGAYNRREARLLTLDDPSGERITPLSAILVHLPDGDLNRLYSFFADWELWTADILESHVSYPMLCYFRSQHVGQSWVTALGVVLDAAALTCACVPGAASREPYFMYRRGRLAVTRIAARLHCEPASDRLNRDLFRIAHERFKETGLEVIEFEEAWQRLDKLRPTYGRELQGLFDYLLAPEGFWGHSAELD